MMNNVDTSSGAEAVSNKTATKSEKSRPRRHRLSSRSESHSSAEAFQCLFSASFFRLQARDSAAGLANNSATATDEEVKGKGKEEETRNIATAAAGCGITPSRATQAKFCASSLAERSAVSGLLPLRESKREAVAHTASAARTAIASPAIKPRAAGRGKTCGGGPRETAAATTHPRPAFVLHVRTCVDAATSSSPAAAQGRGSTPFSGGSIDSCVPLTPAVLSHTPTADSETRSSNIKDFFSNSNSKTCSSCNSKTYSSSEICSNSSDKICSNSKWICSSGSRDSKSSSGREDCNSSSREREGQGRRSFSNCWHSSRSRKWPRTSSSRCEPRAGCRRCVSAEDVRGYASLAAAGFGEEFCISSARRRSRERKQNINSALLFPATTSATLLPLQTLAAEEEGSRIPVLAASGENVPRMRTQQGAAEAKKGTSSSLEDSVADRQRGAATAALPAPEKARPIASERRASSAPAADLIAAAANGGRETSIGAPAAACVITPGILVSSILARRTRSAEATTGCVRTKAERKGKSVGEKEEERENKTGGGESAKERIRVAAAIAHTSTRGERSGDCQCMHTQTANTATLKSGRSCSGKRERLQQQRASIETTLDFRSQSIESAISTRVAAPTSAASLGAVTATTSTLIVRGCAATVAATAADAAAVRPANAAAGACAADAGAVTSAKAAGAAASDVTSWSAPNAASAAAGVRDENEHFSAATSPSAESVFTTVIGGSSPSSAAVLPPATPAARTAEKIPLCYSAFHPGSRCCCTFAAEGCCPAAKDDCCCAAGDGCCSWAAGVCECAGAEDSANSTVASAAASAENLGENKRRHTKEGDSGETNRKGVTGSWRATGPAAEERPATVGAVESSRELQQQLQRVTQQQPQPQSLTKEEEEQQLLRRKRGRQAQQEQGTHKQNWQKAKQQGKKEEQLSQQHVVEPHQQPQASTQPPPQQESKGEETTPRQLQQQTVTQLPPQQEEKECEQQQTALVERETACEEAERLQHRGEAAEKKASLQRRQHHKQHPPSNLPTPSGAFSLPIALSKRGRKRDPSTALARREDSLAVSCSCSTAASSNGAAGAVLHAAKTPHYLSSPSPCAAAAKASPGSSGGDSTSSTRIEEERKQWKQTEKSLRQSTAEGIEQRSRSSGLWKDSSRATSYLESFYLQQRRQEAQEQRRKEETRKQMAAWHGASSSRELQWLTSLRHQEKNNKCCNCNTSSGNINSSSSSSSGSDFHKSSHSSGNDFCKIGNSSNASTEKGAGVYSSRRYAKHFSNNGAIFCSGEYSHLCEKSSGSGVSSTCRSSETSFFLKKSSTDESNSHGVSNGVHSYAGSSSSSSLIVAESNFHRPRESNTQKGSRSSCTAASGSINRSSSASTSRGLRSSLVTGSNCRSSSSSNARNSSSSSYCTSSLLANGTPLCTTTRTISAEGFYFIRADETAKTGFAPAAATAAATTLGRGSGDGISHQRSAAAAAAAKSGFRIEDRAVPVKQRTVRLLQQEQQQQHQQQHQLQQQQGDLDVGASQSSRNDYSSNLATTQNRTACPTDIALQPGVVRRLVNAFQLQQAAPRPSTSRQAKSAAAGHGDAARLLPLAHPTYSKTQGELLLRQQQPRAAADASVHDNVRQSGEHMQLAQQLRLQRGQLEKSLQQTAALQQPCALLAIDAGATPSMWGPHDAELALQLLLQPGQQEQQRQPQQQQQRQPLGDPQQQCFVQQQPRPLSAAAQLQQQSLQQQQQQQQRQSAPQRQQEQLARLCAASPAELRQMLTPHSAAAASSARKSVYPRVSVGMGYSAAVPSSSNIETKIYEQNGAGAAHPFWSSRLAGILRHDKKSTLYRSSGVSLAGPSYHTSQHSHLAAAAPTAPGNTVYAVHAVKSVAQAAGAAAAPHTVVAAAPAAAYTAAEGLSNDETARGGAAAAAGCSAPPAVFPLKARVVVATAGANPSGFRFAAAAAGVGTAEAAAAAKAAALRAETSPAARLTSPPAGAAAGRLSTTAAATANGIQIRSGTAGSARAVFAAAGKTAIAGLKWSGAPFRSAGAATAGERGAAGASSRMQLTSDEVRLVRRALSRYQPSHHSQQHPRQQQQQQQLLQRIQQQLQQQHDPQQQRQQHPRQQQQQHGQQQQQRGKQQQQFLKAVSQPHPEKHLTDVLQKPPSTTSSSEPQLAKSGIRRQSKTLPYVAQLIQAQQQQQQQRCDSVQMQRVVRFSALPGCNTNRSAASTAPSLAAAASPLAHATAAAAAAASSSSAASVPGTVLPLLSSRAITRQFLRSASSAAAAAPAVSALAPAALKSAPATPVEPSAPSPSFPLPAGRKGVSLVGKCRSLIEKEGKKEEKEEEAGVGEQEAAAAAVESTYLACKGNSSPEGRSAQSSCANEGAKLEDGMQYQQQTEVRRQQQQQQQEMEAKQHRQQTEQGQRRIEENGVLRGQLSYQKALLTEESQQQEEDTSLLRLPRWEGKEQQQQQLAQGVAVEATAETECFVGRKEHQEEEAREEQKDESGEEKEEEERRRRLLTERKEEARQRLLMQQDEGHESPVKRAAATIDSVPLGAGGESGMRHVDLQGRVQLAQVTATAKGVELWQSGAAALLREKQHQQQQGMTTRCRGKDEFMRTVVKRDKREQKLYCSAAEQLEEGSSIADNEAAVAAAAASRAVLSYSPYRPAPPPSYPAASAASLFPPALVLPVEAAAHRFVAVGFEGGFEGACCSSTDESSRAYSTDERAMGESSAAAKSERLQEEDRLQQQNFIIDEALLQQQQQQGQGQQQHQKEEQDEEQQKKEEQPQGQVQELEEAEAGLLSQQQHSEEQQEEDGEQLCSWTVRYADTETSARDEGEEDEEVYEELAERKKGEEREEGAGEKEERECVVGVDGAVVAGVQDEEEEEEEEPTSEGATKPYERIILKILQYKEWLGSQREKKASSRTSEPSAAAGEREKMEHLQQQVQEQQQKPGDTGERDGNDASGETEAAVEHILDALLSDNAFWEEEGDDYKESEEVGTGEAHVATAGAAARGLEAGSAAAAAAAELEATDSRCVAQFVSDADIAPAAAVEPKEQLLRQQRQQQGGKQQQQQDKRCLHQTALLEVELLMRELAALEGHEAVLHQEGGSGYCAETRLCNEEEEEEKQPQKDNRGNAQHGEEKEGVYDDEPGGEKGAEEIEYEREENEGEERASVDKWHGDLFRFGVKDEDPLVAAFGRLHAEADGDLMENEAEDAGDAEGEEAKEEQEEDDLEDEEVKGGEVEREGYASGQEKSSSVAAAEKEVAQKRKKNGTAGFQEMDSFAEKSSVCQLPSWNTEAEEASGRTAAEEEAETQHRDEENNHDENKKTELVEENNNRGAIGEAQQRGNEKEEHGRDESRNEAMGYDLQTVEFSSGSGIHLDDGAFEEKEKEDRKQRSGPYAAAAGSKNSYYPTFEEVSFIEAGDAGEQDSQQEQQYEAATAAAGAEEKEAVLTVEATSRSGTDTGRYGPQCEGVETVDGGEAPQEITDKDGEAATGRERKYSRQIMGRGLAELEIVERDEKTTGRGSGKKGGLAAMKMRVRDSAVEDTGTKPREEEQEQQKHTHMVGDKGEADGGGSIQNVLIRRHEHRQQGRQQEQVKEKQEETEEETQKPQKQHDSQQLLWEGEQQQAAQEEQMGVKEHPSVKASALLRAQYLVGPLRASVVRGRTTL